MAQREFNGQPGGEVYKLSLKTNACYGVIRIVKKDTTDAFVVDEPIPAPGPLNNGLIVSSGDVNISVRVPKEGELEADLDIDVQSRPLAYQVVYWQNHDADDNAKYPGDGNTKLYTDFDDRENGTGDTDLERVDIVVDNETYQYHRTTIAHHGEGGAGFTEPTGMNFHKWSVNEPNLEDSNTLIEAGVDFCTIVDACGSLVGDNNVINLYATYVPADTHTVTVYFDSATIAKDSEDNPIVNLEINS